MNSKTYDILVIGGGINGAGIARDAAGRGLSVCMVEQGDLAGATSSSSTKLIHGGLRYLEYYDFGLVREALKERDVLHRMAPHITWPLTFVLPHNKSLRPAWMIRLGLFLYDRLGGKTTLPKSRAINLRKKFFGRPLKDGFKKGFTYSDCWVDDARLVILNAIDARDKGADIHTRTQCTAIRPDNGNWQADMRDQNTGAGFQVIAKAVINATGPWVDRMAEMITGNAVKRHIRLVRGSHIVVPNLYDGDFAYILQNEDRRVVFIIPYEKDFTLIGTTEADYDGDPYAADISAEEIQYLCDVSNAHLKKQISPESVIWNYSGVRPLVEAEGSATAATREYFFEKKEIEGLPLLSIYGGKITTFRKLAESAVDDISKMLRQKTRSWTHESILPGGDNFHAHFVPDFLRDYPWVPTDLARRWVHTYGSRTFTLLSGKESLDDFGLHFGNNLYQAEIDFLIDQEWAQTSEDILWRRTKLGLHIARETQAALENYLREKTSHA